MKLKTWIAALVAGAAVIGATPVMAQEQLTVWRVKGTCTSEDDALFAAIKKYEARHPKVKIALSQHPIQDMIPKTVSALDSGCPPDVACADVHDFQVTAKWAFDGKLEDVTSVIDPIRTRFAPNTVETTFLPGDIHLAPGGQGIAAKVIVVEPTGAETELLQVGDVQLVVVIHGRATAKPDETIHLAIDADKAHVFDTISGKRLG